MTRACDTLDLHEDTDIKKKNREILQTEKRPRMLHLTPQTTTAHDINKIQSPS